MESDGKAILDRARKYLFSLFKETKDLRDYQGFQTLTWLRFTYDGHEDFFSLLDGLTAHEESV